MEDWAISQWAVKDAAAYRSLSRLIDKRTDAIFCEHPWLFAFARKFRAEAKRPKIILVYGSHNVESELKRQIIEAYYGPSYAAECEALVLEAEKDAISFADFISTVSEADALWTKPQTSAPIVVAPNGVAPNRASIHDVVESNPIAGHRKFALYVASGHPPNVFGFYDIFGEGVGCIAPDERLVVAGAAGQSIRNDERFAKRGWPRKMLCRCGHGLGCSVAGPIAVGALHFPSDDFRRRHELEDGRSTCGAGVRSSRQHSRCADSKLTSARLACTFVVRTANFLPLFGIAWKRRASRLTKKSGTRAGRCCGVRH